MMPTVAIVLATCNGEKYLSEQLDSLLNQQQVNVHIYIQDDNSNDNTLNIIKYYKEKYPENFKNLFQCNFNNLCKNFLNLINKIDNHYEYYAFSDQDDVWFQDKLIMPLIF
jgi:glycosyltransferase involved in cell wall biosynthesis